MRRGGRASNWGTGGATDIMITVVMAIVVVFFVIAIVPELEGMTIDPLWSPMTQSMLGLVKWILPVGAIVAVVIMIFRKIKG